MVASWWWLRSVPHLLAVNTSLKNNVANIEYVLLESGRNDFARWRGAASISVNSI